ncbi:MAG TPA: hypothetical protein VLT59_03550, partial [Steroidobacteraceae bacterium]|nr:hypothetical protein [Steroidobacteraceae bacterium]
IEPVVDRRRASLSRAERIWRPALLGIAVALVLAIWTVLVVLMASLHDRGYTSDELVMRDQAIAAASSSAAVATVSDLVDVSAIGNR